MIAHLPSPLGLTAWSNHPGQDILRHKCMYRHIQATENRISGVRPSCVTRSCIRRTHALASTMSLDQKSPKPTRYQPSTYEHSQASDCSLMEEHSAHCLDIPGESIHRIRASGKETYRDQSLDPPDQYITNLFILNQKNRPSFNPSRGRSIRQGGRMGDNYKEIKTCH